jgi:hypothetical protein
MFFLFRLCRLKEKSNFCSGFFFLAWLFGLFCLSLAKSAGGKRDNICIYKYINYITALAKTIGVNSCVCFAMLQKLEVEFSFVR